MKIKFLYSIFLTVFFNSITSDMPVLEIINDKDPIIYLYRKGMNPVCLGRGYKHAISSSANYIATGNENNVKIFTNTGQFIDVVHAITGLLDYKLYLDKPSKISPDSFRLILQKRVPSSGIFSDESVITKYADLIVIDNKVYHKNISDEINDTNENVFEYKPGSHRHDKGTQTEKYKND